MKIFLWTFVIVISLNLMGRLCYLSIGRLPERTMGFYALGTLEFVVWIVWAVVLLAT